MLIGLVKDNILIKTFTLPQVTEAFRRKYRGYEIVIDPNMQCGEQLRHLTSPQKALSRELKDEYALLLTSGLGDMLQLRFVLNAVARSGQLMSGTLQRPDSACSLHSNLSGITVLTSKDNGYLLSDLGLDIAPSNMFNPKFRRVINLNALILSKINAPRIALFTTTINELLWERLRGEKRAVALPRLNAGSLKEPVKVAAQDINVNFVKRLRKRNIIGAQLDASSKYRTFPIEKWKNIFSALPKQKFLVYSKRVRADLPDNCENYTGSALALPELLHKLSSCKAFITTDSFTLHLSAAFNRQCIVLSGPTTPDISAYNQYFIILTGEVGCLNCYDNILERKDCPEITCLESIEEQKVIETLELLK